MITEETGQRGIRVCKKSSETNAALAVMLEAMIEQVAQMSMRYPTWIYDCDTGEFHDETGVHGGPGQGDSRVCGAGRVGGDAERTDGD